MYYPLIGTAIFLILIQYLNGIKRLPSSAVILKDNLN